MSDTSEMPERRAGTLAVADLAQKVEEQTEVVKALRDDIRVDAHWRKRAVVGMGVCLFLLLVFSVAQLAGLYVGTVSRDRIESCTTPEGECYQRGQASQNEAVLQIVCAADANTRLVATAIVRSFQPNAELNLPPVSKACANTPTAAPSTP